MKYDVNKFIGDIGSIKELTEVRVEYTKLNFCGDGYHGTGSRILEINQDGEVGVVYEPDGGAIKLSQRIPVKFTRMSRIKVSYFEDDKIVSLLLNNADRKVFSVQDEPVSEDVREIIRKYGLDLFDESELY